jgi:hypothetical protein
MATESVKKLLGADAGLRPLAERLVLIKRLQKRYRNIAPENLAAASRVCAIEGTTVVICATSGPVAAALRHISPRLLQGLREGWRASPKYSRDQELNSIRIELQVEAAPPKRVVKPRAPMPASKLEEVAGRLADSPLKEELRRIARAAPGSRGKPS